MGSLYGTFPTKTAATEAKKRLEAKYGWSGLKVTIKKSGKVWKAYVT